MQSIRAWSRFTTYSGKLETSEDNWRHARTTEDKRGQLEASEDNWRQARTTGDKLGHSWFRNIHVHVCLSDLNHMKHIAVQPTDLGALKAFLPLN